MCKKWNSITPYVQVNQNIDYSTFLHIFYFQQEVMYNYTLYITLITCGSVNLGSMDVQLNFQTPFQMYIQGPMT